MNPLPTPNAVTHCGVCATKSDEYYGPGPGTDPLNCLDFWQADLDQPTPLVVFYHGGAFIGGDRSIIYGSEEIDQFLKAGVSFATVNYRFKTYFDLGIQGSLCDSARALQFLRSKAVDWNIDKTRVGAYGTSAGAGISLWLALSDDMAQSSNLEDPVLQESTQIIVVGGKSAQASYDILQWPKILHSNVSNSIQQSILKVCL